MKIQQSSSNAHLSELNKTRSDKHIAPKESLSKDSSEVRLSSVAKGVAALDDSSQDVRMEKVQALREAIQNGELVIKPERIADGLLASVKELLK